MTAIDYSRCVVPPGCGPLPFWSLRPLGCKKAHQCTTECHVPGHVLIEREGGGGTFETDDYVRGILYAIIGTDGQRSDEPCGLRPGTRGGHWTERFMGPAVRVGSNLTDLPRFATIAEAVADIRGRFEAAAMRLVEYGVAASTTVTAEYAGRNTVSVTVEINGVGNNLIRVGASAVRLPNGWAWSF